MKSLLAKILFRDGKDKIKEEEMKIFRENVRDQLLLMKKRGLSIPIVMG